MEPWMWWIGYFLTGFILFPIGARIFFHFHPEERDNFLGEKSPEDLGFIAFTGLVVSVFWGLGLVASLAYLLAIGIGYILNTLVSCRSTASPAETQSVEPEPPAEEPQFLVPAPTTTEVVSEPIPEEPPKTRWEQLDLME